MRVTSPWSCLRCGVALSSRDGGRLNVVPVGVDDVGPYYLVTDLGEEVHRCLPEAQ